MLGLMEGTPKETSVANGTYHISGGNDYKIWSTFHDYVRETHSIYGKSIENRSQIASFVVSGALIRSYYKTFLSLLLNHICQRCQDDSHFHSKSERSPGLRPILEVRKDFSLTLAAMSLLLPSAPSLDWRMDSHSEILVCLLRWTDLWIHQKAKWLFRVTN
jgi:hypothetical protein